MRDPVLLPGDAEDRPRQRLRCLPHLVSLGDPWRGGGELYSDDPFSLLVMPGEGGTMRMRIFNLTWFTRQHIEMLQLLFVIIFLLQRQKSLLSLSEVTHLDQVLLLEWHLNQILFKILKLQNFCHYRQWLKRRKTTILGFWDVRKYIFWTILRIWNFWGTFMIE